MPSEYALSRTKHIKQRADLTFKHNANHPRHDWVRLTPAYSVKLVDSILREKNGRLNVLDPFSGTATTTLCAVYRGHYALSTDINPFLIWLGRAKLATYDERAIIEADKIARLIQDAFKTGKAQLCQPPQIFNIERWWSQKNLHYLQAIKGEIERRQIDRPESKNLLLAAFCRTLIELSNAAFNHQSMSFKNNSTGIKQQLLWADDSFCQDSFMKQMKIVLECASNNPVGNGQVIFGDARQIDRVVNREYDLLITSPPYPNRMSYIRELRPYMYWLGYLENAREAGEMDWNAIGGTWGIATSRLMEWQGASNVFYPKYLEKIILKIAESDGKSGALLSNYVKKYFADMWEHFKTVGNVLKTGSEAHYIIGNSKFYDCIVPTEKIYSDMLREAGFRHVEIHVLRKRNSKKELLEFDVMAKP